MPTLMLAIKMSIAYLNLALIIALYIIYYVSYSKNVK